ncbi:MAG: hypothetical protein HYX49_12040 [Chloroflexi bacterium]|nr:hypothetical protein [Chloroflexota bacterium]
MKNTTLLRTLVSVVAIVLLIVHILFPKAVVDAISLGLLLVAILPWLSSLIQSAKFPGGWEITFRDVEVAAQKIVSSKKRPRRIKKTDKKKVEKLFLPELDANLLLVSLRIEIEKRLRLLSQKHGIPEDRSIRRMFEELRKRQILEPSILSGLDDLISAGNRAAHGGSIEPGAATWAEEVAPEILATLDEKIGK